jgi:hypothetical protein
MMKDAHRLNNQETEGVEVEKGLAGKRKQIVPRMLK